MPPHKKPGTTPSQAFNTMKNAAKAIDTACDALPELKPGQIWKHEAPHGIEIKGSLKKGNIHVAVIHFNGEDASVLPRGLHGLSEGRPEIFKLIEDKLKKLPQQMKVLEGAEFREPEECWAIPIALEGRIVSHLKVSADGGILLEDKKIAKELKEKA